MIIISKITRSAETDPVFSLIRAYFCYLKDTSLNIIMKKDQYHKCIVMNYGIHFILSSNFPNRTFGSCTIKSQNTEQNDIKYTTKILRSFKNPKTCSYTAEKLKSLQANQQAATL